MDTRARDWDADGRAGAGGVCANAVVDCTFVGGCTKRGAGRCEGAGDGRGAARGGSARRPGPWLEPVVWGEGTSFERDGYRHTYEPRISDHEIGLIVIGTTGTLKEARQLARKARDALGLVYEELDYRADFGFTLPRESCIETSYPCAPPRRSVYEPYAYVSIERGGYDRWRSGEFLVIAAHGPVGSALLRETSTKAKVAFPEAYEQVTRQVWIEASTTKLP